jgi:hypothetical protein
MKLTPLNNFLLATIILFFLPITNVVAQDAAEPAERKQLYQDGVYKPYDVLDTRVDKMKYWREAARLGLTPVEPYRSVPPGDFKGTAIRAFSVVRDDSPDIPVTSQNSTQSENSIFVNPNDPDHVLQSNNSTQNPVGSLYGANYFFSMDFGQTWGGSIQGAGGSNSGDPATAIGLGGRQYVGYISGGGGQGVSYSDDGVNWTPVIADAGSGSDILDKNHLWIDNSPSSPYEGNVYAAWTDFGGTNDSEIEIVHSTNNGVSYSSALNISSAVNAGSHNQGVNIQTGPSGQVYVVWSIYDSWPSDETAIGFAKSLNGGASYLAATRIISNTRGIRNSETAKNMRVNSFPSMAVDISGGSYNGNIYVVWTNIGIPGINSGADRDIYMIRSGNEGLTWSAPIRINQDPIGQGHQHFFPWISCDPETGTLSVVFYDDRNVGSNKLEVFCANSFDGGDTWEDFRVSDTDFTPAPIPGLAGGYMGDYLGIATRGGKVYPVWTDNRSGVTMTYTSPYETNNLPRPENLTGGVVFNTGLVTLSWEFAAVPGFQNFVVYRDGAQIGTTTQLNFTDILPDYGLFQYQVTAMHNDGESTAAATQLQWGDAHISVIPESITQILQPGNITTRQLQIKNTGQLDLQFSASAAADPTDGEKSYCIPSHDCSYGDGFTGFILEDINNMNSGCSSGGYGDFTSMSTNLDIGQTYQVTFRTGYSNQYVRLWIDFNKNEVFDASEMLLDDFHLPQANQNYTTTITVPAGVQSGITRMRIKANWQNSAGGPCDDTNYGETEDYTVNISGWLTMESVNGTIAPGQSQNLSITLSAEDLDEGIYNGAVTISSNDPNYPEKVVPVQLSVSINDPLTVAPAAQPETIVEGETVQLFANAAGGTGNYTYSWSSNPSGFNSSLANPTVSPMQTTTYFLQVNDGIETAGGQALVTVEPLYETQQISLSEGWNLFSSRVMPDDPDMLNIVQPLIDNDLLFKVIDESGATVFHLPFPPPNGQWSNSIGDIAATEGYYIKVNADATLSLTGIPTALPITIPLVEGWNIISFPSQWPQDAMEVFQPLIDQELLYKVIDQSGGVIFKLPFPPPNGQWTNSIGNMEPGQGYYVKVHQNTTLTISGQAKANLATAAGFIYRQPVYFEPVYTHHPFRPMLIAVKAADWMEPGDEIAVFDGDVCVGVGVYKGSQDDAVMIAVSMDDPETGEIDGAATGNSFTISLWNRNGGALYEDIRFEKLAGLSSFSALESSVVELNPLLTQLISLDKSMKISLFPNPVIDESTLEICLPVSTYVTIQIFDAVGNDFDWKSDEKISGFERLIFNKDELKLTPGVYSMRFIFAEKPSSPAETIEIRKFVVY